MSREKAAASLDVAKHEKGLQVSSPLFLAYLQV